MRKFIISTLGAILALAGTAGTANAANFTDPSFGISINVDDALKKQPLERDIQVFKSKDMSGSLVIKRNYDLAITDFVEDIRGPGYRDDRHNVILRTAGKPFQADIEAGRGLLIPVSGQIVGQQVRGVIGAYSGNNGQGFLVIGTAKPEAWASWEPRLKKMFESVKFVQIDRRAIAKKWQNRLKGKKLQYKQAKVTGGAPAGMPGMPGVMPGMYSGGAVQQDYHLCSDGTLMRKSASVGQVAGQNMMVYGRGMNQGRSSWYIDVTSGEPFLVVREGSEQGLRLESDGDNILLDGDPYVITASELCK